MTREHIPVTNAAPELDKEATKQHKKQEGTVCSNHNACRSTTYLLRRSVYSIVILILVVLTLVQLFVLLQQWYKNREFIFNTRCHLFFNIIPFLTSLDTFEHAEERAHK